MRCIQCGKEVNKPKTVLCSDCTKDKYTCLKGYEEHTLLICPDCGKYKYKKKWNNKSKNAIEESVLHHCSFLVKPLNYNLKINLGIKQGKKQKGEAILKVKSKIENQIVDEEFVLPLKITYAQCDSCAITKTDYFEGILQLRANRDLDKAQDFVLKEVSYRHDVAITKTEKVKNGFDYYFTKQRYIPVIMKKLQERFGASGETHAQLFSRKDGKDIYRVNAIVRLPDFSVGDIVKCNNKILKVVKIGKHATGCDLKTGKSLSFNMKDAEMLDFKVYNVEISKHYPQLEVLHPETYQSVAVANNYVEISKQKKKIKVALIDCKIWALE
ncbi:hypothetical protein COV16_02555 [Candidatus Woesearchaeota archaeon CG10_big_fil_rev_8_21_14_0_10_34_8]|nr:MAG: hypothetical protein COV16_02555 [Candidatus Woesearchaeota archaeon CG10_big_fil_rev_8_21_14_0_10_34_8]